MTRQNKIDDEEILRLWDEGKSINAISKIVLHMHQTVRRHLEKRRVDTSVPRYRGIWTPEQDQRLIIGRNSGRTGKDLYSSVPGKNVRACMNRLAALRRDGRVR